jgi:hypothetical protein
MTDADPTTEELRVSQLEREASERQAAVDGITEDEAEQHARRAEKAGYLREKLEQRAQAEREGGSE